MVLHDQVVALKLPVGVTAFLNLREGVAVGRGLTFLGKHLWKK